jgi:hypothetical protein
VRATVNGRYSFAIVACPYTLMVRVAAAMATVIVTLAAVPGGAPRSAARLNAASEVAAQFRAR